MVFGSWLEITTWAGLLGPGLKNIFHWKVQLLETYLINQLQKVRIIIMDLK